MGQQMTFMDVVALHWARKGCTVLRLSPIKDGHIVVTVDAPRDAVGLRRAVLTAVVQRVEAESGPHIGEVRVALEQDYRTFDLEQMDEVRTMADDAHDDLADPGLRAHEPAELRMLMERAIRKGQLLLPSVGEDGRVTLDPELVSVTLNGDAVQLNTKAFAENCDREKQPKATQKRSKA